MSHRVIWRAAAFAGLLVAGLLVAPSTHAQAAACVAPVPSTTKPGYLVADPNCDLNGTPFEAIPGASQVYTGILDSAAYRIEVPLNWNGELVLYAHGFRGTGTTVFVDSPSLRRHYVANGFAWAASSYQTNGYDVGQGVRDSHALIALFATRTGTPAAKVYMTGVSMGGHITAVTIEHFPSSFAGALPACGVLGDAELFDYFLDVNVTAAAFTGTPITFPAAPVPPDFGPQYTAQVLSELPKLGTGWGTGAPPTLTPLGQQWSGAVEQRSGGKRPGFDAAFGFWNSLPSLAPNNALPFLFGVYPGFNGGTAGVEDGNVTSNRFTIYQTDSNPFLSATEWRLNRDVLRVSRTAQPSPDLSGVPRVNGKPRVPVLSLHTIGDLFVPISMEQVYAGRALLHGRSRLFVSRAIRALGHCEFAPTEFQAAFDDLVKWVRTGKRAAGDEILNPFKVAEPTFGCRFTLVQRANFGAACP